MGRLTWEQAEALVNRAYDPNHGLDLHPSMRLIRIPLVDSPEVVKFGEEFLRKWRERNANSGK